MMKKLLVLSLIASIFYSCKNDKTVSLPTGEAGKDIPISAEKESNIAQTKVLTLGTFHFKFPNLDIVKVDNDRQIDVFDAKYQKEIELIVDKLAKFKPTKIIIERQPKRQQLYDSLYGAYLNGEHKLSRSEEQQIGFRLAKRLGLKQLYCTDAWGTDYEDVKKAVYGNDSIAKGKFMDYFYNNPDSILTSYRNEKLLFKTEGILAQLKKFNSAEYVKKGLGDYLIGIFKYETEDYEQFGPDYVTSWWFNRNLRIFRNIQRVSTKPEDRILVIYGAGHMNLLNIFFEASPEYKLLPINDYLN
jgi:Family of unknown function (DUF5694)